MSRYRYAVVSLLISALMGAALLGYYLWHRYYIRPFACQVNFVQHHPDETVFLWLNYIVDGRNGILSMNGRVKGDPNKVINRKISFAVERKDSVYYLTAEQNMKFPDDNVDDSWLKKYEPLFFVYRGKSIYMRIKEHQNDNYLFVLGTLPTYVCHSSKNG